MTAFGRRTFSALLASAATAAGAGRRARGESALAAPIDADGPVIAVAGPRDSEAARWASLLHAPLAARFNPPHDLRLSYLGSRDGVSGANMFDARALPDGQAALLLPGAAALAWLVGDSRVRFDATRLQPMLAAVSYGVLCTRQSVRDLTAGSEVRLGCDAMVAPALTALMALDMLGAHARPVLASPDCIEAAQRGEVDAVFVRGLEMPRRLSTLARAGLLPAYSVSLAHLGLAAPVAHDLPDLAVLVARTRAKNDPLIAAWRAVVAASLLDAVLAVPRLCPESSLARWRGACDQARMAADVTDRLPENVRLLTGEDSDIVFDSVIADSAAQIALHAWMASELDWRPT